jgi:hypothetical protein
MAMREHFVLVKQQWGIEVHLSICPKSLAPDFCRVIRGLADEEILLLKEGGIVKFGLLTLLPTLGIEGTG